jgi:PEP-CTERM motif
VNASRTYSPIGLVLASAATLGWSTAEVAAQNYAPPSGSVIDLSDPTSYSSVNGNVLPDTPTPYTSMPFNGGNGETALTFLFRDDFANIVFSNVFLFDVTTGTLAPLLNGNFSGGTYTSSAITHPITPNNWTFINPNLPGVFVDGNFASQVKPVGQCVVVGNCWTDGTAEGYDELSQTVLMNSSDSYRISFDAAVTATLPESNTTWSDINTTSGAGFAGNAADILAYVGQVGDFKPIVYTPPPIDGGMPTPEPSTWAMMLFGFAGLTFIGYRRASARAS